jgi:lysine 6-dehydrogenase
MKKIAILGAGMVGRAMAVELSKKYKVASYDIDSEAIGLLKGKTNIKTGLLDVKDGSSLAAAVKDSDLVISAVPGFLGLQTMAKVINLKKDLIDISFMPEDVLYLDPLARDNRVTVVMDCGVAPGLPNYIVGLWNEKMKIEEVLYYVGGLPKIRKFPFEYKAPFSPKDVIEEYMRPSRFVENGKLVVKPAMSDPELICFESVGTLEAFNTDGLRSLIYTMKNIPRMKEKTLRYAGHIYLIQALKAAGFFEQDPVKINGIPVIPFDFTSEILFNEWKQGIDDPEFTVLRVIITGSDQGSRKEITYELYDEFDEVNKVSSMARTTGFTATATAELILNKIFDSKGVFPPELVGKNKECFEFVNQYLSKKNINFKITERIL